MDFTEATYSFIRSSGMFRQKGSVTVGISGGADSVCLFLQLNKLKERLGIDLRAITVEHGIRGSESEKDSEFARELCQSHGVSCKVVRVDASARAREKGISLEEAARQLRYQAFFDNTKEGDYIAIAHHLEDQAETVLFHMIRGSGVRGLIGIRPVTEMRGRHIVRPLLFATKDQILAELSALGQDYRTDQTNSDIRYARNRIREVIMPELMKINKGAIRHICESAESVGELYDHFISEEKELYQRALVPGDRKEENRLIVKELIALPDSSRRMIIMEYLRDTLSSIKDVGRAHIERISGLLEDSAHFSYSLPGRAELKLEYGMLSVTYPEEQTGPYLIDLSGLESDGEYSAELGGITLEMRIIKPEKALIEPKTYEKCLDYDKIKKGLCLRDHREGDFFTIDRQGHRKSYKDYCRNQKIQTTDRGRIPLLVYENSHIAWAVGYRISEDVKVTEATRRVLWIKAILEEDNGRQNQSHAH